MLRLALGLMTALFLAACGADNKWATDAEVAHAVYVDPGPPSITLFTVISNRDNVGAHSGLMINGSQRVLFDPAGSWELPLVPERHDLHYGLTPKMVAFYIDYHARVTYRVQEQTVLVTPEVAEMAIQAAANYGSVPKANCANSISHILRGLPGFETIPQTFFPRVLAKGFGALPGATDRVITDDDADKNHGVLMVQANGKPEE